MMDQSVAHPHNINNSHKYRIKTIDGETEEVIGSSLDLVMKREVALLELHGQRFEHISETRAPVLRSWPLTSVLSYWEV